MKKYTFCLPHLTSVIKESFLKLTPQAQFGNPVMLSTYIAAVVATLFAFMDIFEGPISIFHLLIAFWLWCTVFIANFATAMAECRGKMMASGLKKTQFEIVARKLIQGNEKKISAKDLKKGDIVVCEIGDIVPADGEVIQGIATVDESAITGESAPVIRESGGDRSAVITGTRIINDKLIIRVTSDPGHSFIDKMIDLIEGTKKQKSTNENALNAVLSALCIIFLLTVLSIKSLGDYSSSATQNSLELMTIPVLAAVFVCLIPTTISALLSAIGIAGMDRLVKKNVVAKNSRSVEASGDIDLMILDKTGTITLGNRMAMEFYPADGIGEEELARIALLSSLSDETPEGRSIVHLSKTKYNIRTDSVDVQNTKPLLFSSATKMSGIDFYNEKGEITDSFRKGSVEAIKEYVERSGYIFPEKLRVILENISQKGGTPLAVSKNAQVVGGVYLKDIVKGGTKEKFAEMRKMGIKTMMVTGDNLLTAAAIAAETGVDDFLAQATPEMKLSLIRKEQNAGHLIAMIGDGTNDAPALAQANIGVAMNTGTQASREAGNMVDLDSNPTKLLDIVKIGKQLLMTRGSLTTFSLTNDIAKYFAIIPALFGTLYATNGMPGPLSLLNIMHLASPKTAILSTLIFNALVIVFFIPLALRGVSYHPQPAAKLLRNNLLIYGLGGFIAPFLGIKAIDLILSHLSWSL